MDTHKKKIEVAADKLQDAALRLALAAREADEGKKRRRYLDVEAAAAALLELHEQEAECTRRPYLAFR